MRESVTETRQREGVHQKLTESLPQIDKYCDMLLAIIANKNHKYCRGDNDTGYHVRSAVYVDSNH